MKYKIRFKHWICTKLFIFGYPAGIVLYPYILFKREPDQVSNKLFRHEMEHVYQIEREGWFKFYIKYLWYQLRYGYKHNPYEIQANIVENIPLTEKEQQLFNNAKEEYYNAFK